MALQIAYPEGSTPSGDITADKLADGVLTNAVRRGALFSSTSTVVQVAYAPSTSAGFNLEFRTVIDGTSSGVVFGRVVSGYAGIQIISDGRIRLRNGVGTVATTSAQAPIGASAKVRAEIGADATLIYVDDVLLETLTYASISWSTTASTYSIGGQSEGVTMFNGRLWDVSLIDPADDTNTAVYTLDGPSGFENSHPGSTVADATVTGNVSYALVPSSDGGRPVKVHSAVLTALASTTTAATTGATTYYPVHDITRDDPAGLKASNFVAAISGKKLITARWHGLVKLSSKAGTGDLGIRVGGPGITTYYTEAISDLAEGGQQHLSFSRSWVSDVTGNIFAQLGDLDALDTWQVLSATFEVVQESLN